MAFIVTCSASECTAGDVRLVGGTNNYNGQVQVCYEGVWGTVASDGWDSNNALVVCRQLGYPEISEILVTKIVLKFNCFIL